MNTPICDFVDNYENKECSRLHMPGHKGHVFLGCESKDITEIQGADVLHAAEGIIQESQRNAAQLFGARHTFFSTEGSSLCIKVMIDALLQRAKRVVHWKKGSRPTILAARNVHRAMIDACALLDVDIVFLPEEDTHLCTAIASPAMLRQVVSELTSSSLSPMQSCNLIGVYVTSPDYLGNMQDIAGLSAVCKEYDLPLAVDNAHGAYLNFLEKSLHPLHLGADLCCDSAHKTLPVLTGGAYLHIAKKANGFAVERIPRAMALFGSTSPSYLILQSLDHCNRYLAENYTQKLGEFILQFQQCRQILQQNNFVLTGQEPLKLTIHAAAMHVDGEWLANQMRKAKIECEYADHQYVVLMGTPENTEQDLERIKQFAHSFHTEHAAQECAAQKCTTQECLSIAGSRQMDRCEQNSMKEDERSSKKFAAQFPARACTIREAVFAECEEIDVLQAEGRICGAETVSCPPAVPIAVCGEIITKEMIHRFMEYGITKVSVLVKG